MLGYEKLDCPKLSRDEQILLADRARSGCVSSRNQLIESVIPWVLHRCRLLMGGHDEDFIQHCMTQIVAGLGKFDARKSTISTYVERRVYWEFLDKLKDQRRAFNFTELPDVEDDLDLELQDFKIDIGNQLSKLTRMQRATLLRWARGSTLTDIARLRRVTKDVPRQSILHSIKRLKECWSQ